MNPLLVILPYCQKDTDQTRDLLQWIADLNKDFPKHPAMLLAADSTVPRSTIDELARIACESFDYAKTMLVPIEEGDYPPSKMFLMAARQVQTQYKHAFLWLEPDCIPLTERWLHGLAEAYEASPKQYVGSLIRNDKDPALPKIHFTGCGIYKNGAYSDLKSVPDISKRAWDMVAASVLVPKADDTLLIHHHWGGPNTPPVFVEVKEESSPKHHVTLDFVRPGAVLFHRSKGGELIRILRAKRAIVKQSGPVTVPTDPAEMNGELPEESLEEIPSASTARGKTAAQEDLEALNSPSSIAPNPGRPSPKTKPPVVRKPPVPPANLKP